MNNDFLVTRNEVICQWFSLFIRQFGVNHIVLAALWKAKQTDQTPYNPTRHGCASRLAWFCFGNLRHKSLGLLGFKDGCPVSTAYQRLTTRFCAIYCESLLQIKNYNRQNMILALHRILGNLRVTHKLLLHSYMIIGNLIVMHRVVFQGFHLIQ